MANTEKVTLGGGCFWCLEAVYQDLKGVDLVESGYAGGHVENPTYREVCGEGTGHAEVVQVTYDPSVITIDDLLDIFFTIHDPTTPNRQGNDVGPQYRSIILYHNDAQRDAAEKAVAKYNESGFWGSPIVTEVVPLTIFYRAEDYHQNYFKNNPGQGYCRIIVAPKVAKARAKFYERYTGN